MKKIIPAYLVIAFLWALISTMFGVNSTPGQSSMFNFGKNVPSAFVWPYGILTSPFKLYRWVTTPSMSPVFQGAYDSCITTTASENQCKCMVKIMQKNFTETEMSQIDVIHLQNQPQSPKFSKFINEVRSQCPNK